MWVDILDGNRFLKNIYNNVSDLIDVRISKIILSDEGEKVTIAFDMPYFADKPPKKWIDLSHNTTIVEIDFYDIQELSIKSVKDRYRGDIKISKGKSDEIIVNIVGSIEVNIIANVGNISSVKGYYNSP